jgi:hypothetical protein
MVYLGFGELLLMGALGTVCGCGWGAAVFHVSKELFGGGGNRDHMDGVVAIRSWTAVAATAVVIIGIAAFQYRKAVEGFSLHPFPGGEPTTAIRVAMMLLFAAPAMFSVGGRRRTGQ